MYRSDNLPLLCAFVAFSAFVGFIDTAAAQQKTAKACQQEWRANKADFQAKGVTEKAYVSQCRTGASTETPGPAASAPPPQTNPDAGAKTAKACQQEWRANKAAYQSAKISEKTYVEKCRAGEAVALPNGPAAAPQSAPTATAPAPTQSPAQSTAPPPRHATARPTETRGGQYQNEVQAKAECGGDAVVWANLRSKIYHFAGHKDYGTTEHGAYMCEKQAVADGYRASKTEKHPGAS